MVVVLAHLRRARRVDAVGLSEVCDQVLGDGRVEHPAVDSLQIGERLGVALVGVLGVAPDNLLETAVFGHEQASLDTPAHPAARYREMACDVITTGRAIPLRRRDPGWGGHPLSRRPIDAVAGCSRSTSIGSSSLSSPV